ncbi:hypothetical protein [Methanobrevibacter curvatus]|nr:hypothetical protein [Methanobrevibacter curvatus]
MYDKSNNIMNPPSPLGFFIYKVFGVALDNLEIIENEDLMNIDPVKCTNKFLDILGTNIGLKRGNYNDLKYRVLLILEMYCTKTVQGLKNTLDKIMDIWEYEDLGGEEIQVIVNKSKFRYSDKTKTNELASDKNTESGDILEPDKSITIVYPVNVVPQEIKDLINDYLTGSLNL